ncbi:MAG: site-specific integrase [Chlamydiales bacterium]
MEGEVCDKRHFPRKENEEQTFAAFIDKYIDLELPKKPKSYKKQRMQLLWWKQQLGDYFLVYVTNSMISELRDKLLSEKLPKGTKRTSSTTNRYLAALSHAYTVAMKDWGWVNENPVLKVRRPKENKARERFLEKHEIEVLLNECLKIKSPYIYPVVFLAIATGARKGELLALKWKDIDFTRARLTFRDTKNGKSRSIHFRFRRSSPDSREGAFASLKFQGAAV